MASSDIGDWYRGIPQVTKYWFTGSVVVPLIGRLGILSPLWFILDFKSFIYKFQIWRPVTAALFYPISGPKGFHFLMNLYFLYSYSTRLETETFAGSPADYAFLLLFNWICLVVSFDLHLIVVPHVCCRSINGSKDNMACRACRKKQLRGFRCR